MIYACKRCGGFKRAPNVTCSNPCARTKEDVTLSPHQRTSQTITSQSHGPIVPVPTPPNLQIDENRLFPNCPELANPYSGVYDRLGAIREECSVMLAKKKEFDIWESIRKPILDKERDVLTNLLQSLGEIVDDQRKMREQHPELQAIIPKPKKAEKPKEESDEKPQKKQLNRPKGKSGAHYDRTPVEARLTDQTIERIAEYLATNGPAHATEIYEHLLANKYIVAIARDRPGVSLAMMLAKYKQTRLHYVRTHKLWEVAKKNTNGAVVVPSNAIPHTNGHTNGFARAKPSKEDHAKALFAMAVNSVFKMQDNQPMGLRQIWEVVESDLADHVKQLVGAQDFEGFKVMMGQCIGDFGAMEGGLFYPVHPDNTQTVVTKAGRMVTL